jgi:hypothetical protein
VPTCSWPSRSARPNVPINESYSPRLTHGIFFSEADIPEFAEQRLKESTPGR